MLREIDLESLHCSVGRYKFRESSRYLSEV